MRFGHVEPLCAATQGVCNGVRLDSFPLILTVICVEAGVCYVKFDGRIHLEGIVESARRRESDHPALQNVQSGRLQIFVDALYGCVFHATQARRLSYVDSGFGGGFISHAAILRGKSVSVNFAFTLFRHDMPRSSAVNKIMGCSPHSFLRVQKIQFPQRIIV